MIRNRRLGPRTTKSRAVALAAASFLILCHCAPFRPTSEVQQSSPKLNPFIHFEQGTVLFIGVDGRAAQYVKEDENSLFPLGLGLANVSNGSLTLRRESFVLEDSGGRLYPVVSHEEFNRDYGRSRQDARLADSLAEVMNTRFGNYIFVPWRLFPFKGENTTASEMVELGRRHWTLGYLYFPIPEEGIHGKSFTLLVDADEVPETLLVHFDLK